MLEFFLIQFEQQGIQLYLGKCRFDVFLSHCLWNVPLVCRYTVVHRGHFDMGDTLESRERHLVRRPKELVVTVDVPKMVRMCRVP